MQDFFNRFFGGQGGGQGGDGDDDGGQTGERRALGSGFIVDSRGYIITNNHVVDKADKIFVKLSTDAENPSDPGRPATVVGVDKDTDIAVIKIDPPAGLPTIKIGNSDGAQVGDWVLAIGSPFSLSKTVTAGIISAKNRTIDEPAGPGNVATNQFQRFIQTDAAINPGNLGRTTGGHGWAGRRDEYGNLYLRRRDRRGLASRCRRTRLPLCTTC